MTQGRWLAVHGRQRSLVSCELARWWRRPTWTTRADRTRQEGEVAAHGIEREERRRRPNKAGRGGGCGGGERWGLGSVMGDRDPQHEQHGWHGPRSHAARSGDDRRHEEQTRGKEQSHGWRLDPVDDAGSRRPIKRARGRPEVRRRARTAHGSLRTEEEAARTHADGTDGGAQMRAGSGADGGRRMRAARRARMRSRGSVRDGWWPAAVRGRAGGDGRRGRWRMAGGRL
ncbi:hypothetical protein PVAP13_5NG185862 [Panicum virgatum]|uniref:Uncharacterized protein n=1 Tax=Panicum virgatum TaxID=38727 RepID=A0A8T0RSZ8_PANVG|nr:hypothetical protein PVAP13_5NG185862 [Panicum virgatum]